MPRDCISSACIAKLLRQYFNVTSMMLLGIAGLFTLTALISPSWIVEKSSAEHFFGLFLQKYLPEYDSKNNTCKRTGSDLRDRLDSVAAMSIIGLVLFTAFTFLMAWKLVRRAWFEKCGFRSAAIVGYSSAAFFIIAMSIFSQTFNSWFICGESYCEYFHDFKYCGIGYSFKIIIVCTIGIVLVTSMLFLGEKYKEKRDELRIAMVLLCLTCAIAALIGIVEPHWMQWQDGNDSTRTEWGIFFSCTGMGGDCTTNTYPPGEFSPRAGCKREWSALGARYKSTAAFLILSLIDIAVLFFFFMLRFYECIKIELSKFRKLIIVILLGFAGFCQFIALAVFWQTMNSWYMCGEHFCYNTKSSCNLGLSFILGAVSLTILCIVFVWHMLEALEAFCFSPHASEEDPFALRYEEADEAMATVSSKEAT